MKKTMLFFAILMIGMLTACSESEVEPNDNDDESKDENPPLFRNLKYGYLPKITHDSDESIDLFETIDVIDNETSVDDIELTVSEHDGYDGKTPGIYTLKYSAKDEAENESFAYRQIFVYGEDPEVEDTELVKEDTVLDGIPVTTRYYDDGEAKPVIFYFHGFSSDKDKGDQGRGEKLASLGYYVISMDAYLHGERTPEYFEELSNIEKQKDIINISMQTAEDAERIYDKYYREHPNTVKDEWYAFGVSMGAASTFYLASISDLDGMVSLLGSPSFVDFYEYKQKNFDWEKDDYYEKNLSYYESKDPLINPETTEGTKMFLAVGESDTVVPLDYSLEFFRKTERKDVIYEAYPTNHFSTPEMLEDAYLFLRNP